MQPNSSLPTQAVQLELSLLQRVPTRNLVHGYQVGAEREDGSIHRKPGTDGVEREDAVRPVFRF